MPADLSQLIHEWPDVPDERGLYVCVHGCLTGAVVRHNHLCPNRVKAELERLEGRTLSGVLSDPDFERMGRIERQLERAQAEIEAREGASGDECWLGELRFFESEKGEISFLLDLVEKVGLAVLEERERCSKLQDELLKQAYETSSVEMDNRTLRSWVGTCLVRLQQAGYTEVPSYLPDAVQLLLDEIEQLKPRPGRKLGPWVEAGPDDVQLLRRSEAVTTWIRRDEDGQVRARITFYEEVGAVTDLYFSRDDSIPPHDFSHGSSIGVQMAWADKAMAEAGHQLAKTPPEDA